MDVPRVGPSRVSTCLGGMLAAGGLWGTSRLAVHRPLLSPCLLRLSSFSYTGGGEKQAFTLGRVFCPPLPSSPLLGHRQLGKHKGSFEPSLNTLASGSSQIPRASGSVSGSPTGPAVEAEVSTHPPAPGSPPAGPGHPVPSSAICCCGALKALQ